MFFKSKLFLWVSLLVFSFETQPQVYFRLEGAGEVVKKKLDAVAMIEISGTNIEIKGTAFFVGKEGMFLTNHHVMEPFLNDIDTKITISTLADGELTGTLTLLACSDERSIDLCLLKIDKKRQFPEHFVLKAASVNKGEHVYSIGHCSGSYVAKEHMVEKIWDDIYTYVNQVKNYKSILVKKRNFKVKSLELKRPLSPTCQKQGQYCPIVFLPNSPCQGDSGGPIFNSRGELVGVVAELIGIANTQETLENMLTGKEVEKFIQDNSKNKGSVIDPKRLIGPQTIESLLKD